MKIKARSLIYIFLSFIMAFNIKPVTVFASTKTQKTVRVGYYQNEAFEEGASKDAVKRGYAYEYYRKISEYTGWNYEYVYGDFVTIYNMLLRGDVDLVAGLAYTLERRNIVSYPEKPMGSEEYSLVKHEGDETLNQNPMTLSGKSIGVLNSAIKEALEVFLERKNVKAHIVSYSDYDALLAAFDKREIDALAGENDGIYDRSHAEILYSFGYSDYYLCTSIDRPDLLRELNDAQSQLFSENPDYISSLRNKYYPSTLASRAFTNSEKEWLAVHDSIVVGYLNDYMPYSATDKNGKVTGMVKELVPYMFKELGYENISVQYTGFDTYDELVKAMADESVELAFPVGGGLFFSEEDGMFFSNPVISSLTDLVYTTDFFGTNNQNFAVNEKNKLQYYYILNHYPNAEVSFYSSIEECLKAVQKGEASYTTLNGLRTSSILKNSDYDKLTFRQLGNADDRCFGVKIGNAGLLKLIDRGLNRTGAEYIQNLASSYTDKMYSYTIKEVIKDNFWSAFVVFIITFVILASLLAVNIYFGKKRIKEKEVARSALEKANQDKFVIVNKLTNYMREPTKNIISLIHLSEKSEDTDFIKGNLDQMASYSKELISIINNILNMARFESGQIKIEDQLNLYNFYGKRALVVEDTLPNQNITGKILKKAGFEVQSANDGQDAYEKVKAAPTGYFNLVLMNVDEKILGAYESVLKIRGIDNKEKSETPVVALTAVDDFDRSDVNSCGMNGVITKPFEIGSMLETLSCILN